MKTFFGDNLKFFLLLLIGAVGALLIFNFNCNNIEKPILKPLVKIVERIKIDSTYAKKVIDSFNMKLRKVEERAIKSEKSTLFYQSENRRIAAILKSRDTSTGPVIDNEYYSQQEAVDELIRSSELADSACNETIIELKNESKLKDSILLAKDGLIEKKSVSIYELMANNDKASRYIKKLEKSAKWAKVGRFSWKAIAVILATIFTVGLIK